MKRRRKRVGKINYDQSERVRKKNTNYIRIKIDSSRDRRGESGMN